MLHFEVRNVGFSNLLLKESSKVSLYKLQFFHHHPSDLILLKLEFQGSILQGHKLLQILYYTWLFLSGISLQLL